MYLLRLLMLCGVMAWFLPAVEEDPESPDVDPVPASDRISGSSPTERAASLLRACTMMPTGGNGSPKAAVPRLVARMLAEQERPAAVTAFVALAERMRDTTRARLAAKPGDGHALDPFDKQALVHGWLLCRAVPGMTEEAAAAIRDYVALWRHRRWVGYGALNYRLMNDGAGFLAAEQWPDLVDADGLDATGIRTATKDRLLGYCASIVHRNHHEFGAPTYGGVDLSAVKMLADFAQDPEVRQRAVLTLDWMLLNVASAWNQGYHVTPAGRAKYFGTTMTSPDDMDALAAIGWIFYGAHRPVRGMTGIHSGWFAFPGGTYQPPTLFTAIATDRAAPSTTRGSVLTGDAEIRYTIHHDTAYSLTSAWERLPSPSAGHYKESRRQMLKWVSDQPQSTFAPMQDNPRRPYKLQENVANAFGYGENPFAQTLQHERTLIGITAVPADYPYFRQYIPFTTAGAIVLRQEVSGWIICHGGSVLFAFRSLQPATWAKSRAKERCDVLECQSRINGWILETSPLAPYAGGGPAAELARFAAALTSRTRIDQGDLLSDRPRFTYTALDGHVLDLAFRGHREPYRDQHRIDGVPVDYGAFPLLGSPWVQQAVDGDRLTVRHGGQELVYDFKAWTCAGR